ADDADFTVAVHGDQIALAVVNDIDIDKLDRTRVAIADRRPLDALAGCTADMERTHGKLSSRLTDGLGGYNADRLSDFSDFPLSEVAAVAHCANTPGRPAGKRRADIYLFDSRILDFDDLLLIYLRPHRDDHFGGNRIDYVLLGRTAQDAVSQPLNYFTGFQQRLHLDSVHRGAIGFRYYHILGNVH